MKVSVEVITGTFIDTEVSENATVKELKEKIAIEVKLSVKRLILVIGGDERRIVMENEDEMLLSDLGVSEDSHVYLFFKHLDLVSILERSRGNDDDDSMEEVSSVAESGRGNEEEEEEKAKVDGEEEEDKAMNDEKEEDKDEKIEDEEKEEKNEEEEEEAKDDDDDVKEEAKEVEDKDNKEET